MYDSFENNNGVGNVSIFDSSILTKEEQVGTGETLVDIPVSDSTLSDDDTSDSLSIFQVDDDGYLLVKDNDLYNLITEIKEDLLDSQVALAYRLDNLDKDVRILTLVVLVFAFGFFMRLIIRRIFGRWFNG